jgi:hypothetical protein
VLLVAGCGFFPMKVLSLKEGAAVMKAGTPRTIANCPGAAVSGAGRYGTKESEERRGRAGSTMTNLDFRIRVYSRYLSTIGTYNTLHKPKKKRHLLKHWCLEHMTFHLAPTFQINLIGNSLTQSFRILTGYIAIR